MLPTAPSPLASDSPVRALLVSLISVALLSGEGLGAQAPMETLSRAEAQIARLERRISALETPTLSERLQHLEDSLSQEVPLLPRGTRHFEFESPEGDFRMRVGGRLQLDLGFFGQNRRFEEERGRLEDAIGFRRARIDVRGRLHRNIYVAIGYEMRGGSMALLPAYTELRGLPRRIRVRVGYTRAPFGLQAASSSLHLPHLERGAINRLSPGLRAGVFVSGTEFGESFRWAVSVFRDTTLFGDSETRDDRAYGAALRLSGEPWRSEEGFLHLGFGLAVEDYGRVGVRFRERPGIRLAPFTVDTQVLDASSSHTLGAELAVVRAPFEFSADAVWLQLRGLSGEDGETWLSAYQARVSWFLTGEIRAFDFRRGGFAALTPRRPWPEGPGAWELGLRFEHLDLDAGPVRGGEQTIYTALLAWHLDGSTRITLAWLHTRLEGGLRADLVVMRFQIDF
jgi:phosphate-selective porin OprO and OprP